MDFEGNTNRRKTHNPLPSTDANSSSAAGGKYEVFLSFRGEDTRKGFTDFLYTNLGDAGIRTFRDDDELGVGKKIGPDLLEAIEESKISIPIFSKDYASSKWCLLELSKMVECYRIMGQKILPIFYDVKPSDVRHQTGSYKNAFLKHEKDFDEKTVQGWKEALREVVDLKGWELEKETSGHQGKLVRMVVNEVLLELKKNHMVLNDNLVGMDHHVEEMMKLLNIGSNDVLIVGIHGMGGIGKTTIAKFIYNQLLQGFECCCFLTDVREKSLRKGLVDLQNQLISKLRQGKCSNTNIVVDGEEGIATIKDIVGRKKVLIILDDVDQKSQFDKLAGKCDWFGPGSRIILTTRNKEVLDKLEVDETYEPPMMESDHSLQIFSRHAFRSDFPPKDYDILSNEIVSTAAGLPLALEVFGSLFLGKGIDEWKKLLLKLKEIPNNEVLDKLMISYEALEHEQKQIFLDIACLFVGEDKKYPCYMWDARNFFPGDAINVLVLRSLVKISDDKFMMHDQLRDLGREIVRRENFDNPEGRTRLWRHEEVSHILENRMGTKKVQALILKQKRLEPLWYLTNEEFGQLPKLRYLQVEHADLTGDFKHLFSELRWLDWDGGHYGVGNLGRVNFAPTSFHLKNLVILRLSDCVIKDDTWSEMKMPQNLKVLHLSCVSGFKRLPNLSTPATLEVLNLNNCFELVQIDPRWIGNLINLTELSILSCENITELPSSIGRLKKLERMDISGCHNLKGKGKGKGKGKIPWSIGTLSSLRILILCDTGIYSLPTSVSGLSRLQTLDLRRCHELKSLPKLPHSLMDLRVSSQSITTFPSLSNLVNLKELHLSLQNYSIEIPGDIGKLSKLETLIFSESNIINSLPAEIGALSHLKILEVKSCCKLRFIVGLPSSLFELCLDYCDSLKRWPDLSNLKNLSKLRLIRCPKLKRIQGLEQLESLRYLHVSECKSVDRLSDLSNLKSLKELRISVLDNLTKIRGLEELKSLEVLDIKRCKLLKLPDLSNLKNLKSSSISLMSESD